MKYPTTERVLSIFSELNQIPRPSHHEERVADYLCQFAERLHLEYERDAENCVVIRKPATAGYESSEPIVLLNHMDMVCVGMSDPLHDSVKAYVDDGWMRAEGTSLGADNGIGLSMALAVLESDTINHPALEVITTTNEEDGMTGAARQSKDFLRGRKVINLDSEDYDTITTGAAGACLQLHRLPMQPELAPSGKYRWYHIRFEGGLGGHSGVDINKGRCSAVIPAWAILAAIYNAYDFRLSSIRVGEANASIASSADLILCVRSGEASEFVKAQEESINEWLREEYGAGDPGMHCTITKCDRQETVIPTETFEALMDFLDQTPQGVVKMSETMQDTMETSNNVASIVTSENSAKVVCSHRSNVMSALDNMAATIKAAFQLAGAEVVQGEGYPAWKMRHDSKLTALTVETYKKLFGKAPKVLGIHAGLECGLFSEKYPNLDMVSFGPTLRGVHSPDERLHIPTVQMVWDHLLEILKNIPQK